MLFPIKGVEFIIMKKQLIIFLCLFLAVSTVHAMGSAPPPGMNTGDAGLDDALRQIEARAGEPGGEEEIGAVMKKEYGVTQKEIDALRKRGYRVSEIYYMALLARHQNRRISEIASMHAKGVGWGVLAKRLGVHPGDLNRLRARHHQLERHRIRNEQHREPVPGPEPKPRRPNGRKR